MKLTELAIFTEEEIFELADRKPSGFIGIEHIKELLGMLLIHFHAICI